MILVLADRVAIVRGVVRDELKRAIEDVVDRRVRHRQARLVRERWLRFVARDRGYELVLREGGESVSATVLLDGRAIGELGPYEDEEVARRVSWRWARRYEQDRREVARERERLLGDPRTSRERIDVPVQR